MFCYFHFFCFGRILAKEISGRPTRKILNNWWDSLKSVSKTSNEQIRVTVSTKRLDALNDEGNHMKPNLFVIFLQCNLWVRLIFFVVYVMQHEIVWRLLYINKNVKENDSLIEKLLLHVPRLVKQADNSNRWNHVTKDFQGILVPS